MFHTSNPIQKVCRDDTLIAIEQSHNEHTSSSPELKSNFLSDIIPSEQEVGDLVGQELWVKSLGVRLK